MQSRLKINRDPDAVNIRLVQAIQSGEQKIAQDVPKLLAAGAFTNFYYPCEFATKNFVASFGGQDLPVTYTLQYGYPLEVAIANNNTSNISNLLKIGHADPNPYPVKINQELRNREIKQFCSKAPREWLKQHSADYIPTSGVGDLRNPVTCAANAKNWKIVRMLAEDAAPLSHDRNILGCALWHAVAEYTDDSLNAALALLKAGANPDVLKRDAQGNFRYTLEMLITNIKASVDSQTQGEEAKEDNTTGKPDNNLPVCILKEMLNQEANRNVHSLIDGREISIDQRLCTLHDPFWQKLNESEQFPTDLPAADPETTPTADHTPLDGEAVSAISTQVDLPDENLAGDEKAARACLDSYQQIFAILAKNGQAANPQKLKKCSLSDFRELELSIEKDPHSAEAIAFQLARKPQYRTPANSMAKAILTGELSKLTKSREGLFTKSSFAPDGLLPAACEKYVTEYSAQHPESRTATISRNLKI